jgi:hypothetical protein
LARGAAGARGGIDWHARVRELARAEGAFFWHVRAREAREAGSWSAPKARFCHVEWVGTRRRRVVPWSGGGTRRRCVFFGTCERAKRAKRARQGVGARRRRDFVTWSGLARAEGAFFWHVRAREAREAGSWSAPKSRVCHVECGSVGGTRRRRFFFGTCERAKHARQGVGARPRRAFCHVEWGYRWHARRRRPCVTWFGGAKTEVAQHSSRCDRESLIS